MIPVNGHNNLIRDEYSNAVINNDITAFEQFKRSRIKEKEQEQRMADLENKVENIENLLKIIIQKIT